ncbi:MAG: zinc ribbon domain-containing protein [Candidatus Acidiferrales bacterium]
MTQTTQPCAQCAAEIPASAKYCPECGVRLPGTPEPPALVPARPPWHGRKFVIWFLIAVFVVGVLFISGALYFVDHTTIVTSGTNGGRTEAPFGTLSTSKNPAKLAHTLGLDVYPGATSVEGTEAQLAHSVIISIEFASAATPADIIHYYHIRYPDASVSLNATGRTLVQMNPRDTMTIAAERSGKNTRILVSDVRH